MNNGEWPKLVSELDLVGLTHRNVSPLLTYVIYLSCQFTRSLLIHIAPRKKYPQTETHSCFSRALLRSREWEKVFEGNAHT